MSFDTVGNILVVICPDQARDYQSSMTDFAKELESIARDEVDAGRPLFTQAIHFYQAAPNIPSYALARDCAPDGSRLYTAIGSIDRPPIHRSRSLRRKEM